jgi:hypothetical protein
MNDTCVKTMHWERLIEVSLYPIYRYFYNFVTCLLYVLLHYACHRVGSEISRWHAFYNISLNNCVSNIWNQEAFVLLDSDKKEQKNIVAGLMKDSA